MHGRMSSAEIPRVLPLWSILPTWVDKDPLLCADAVPIVLRIVYRQRFEAGPFKLGRLQPFLNVLALLWIALIVVSIHPTCMTFFASLLLIAHILTQFRCP